MRKNIKYLYIGLIILIIGGVAIFIASKTHNVPAREIAPETNDKMPETEVRAFTYDEIKEALPGSWRNDEDKNDILVISGNGTLIEKYEGYETTESDTELWELLKNLDNTQDSFIKKLIPNEQVLKDNNVFLKRITQDDVTPFYYGVEMPDAHSLILIYITGKGNVLYFTRVESK